MRIDEKYKQEIITSFWEGFINYMTSNEPYEKRSFVIKGISDESVPILYADFSKPTEKYTLPPAAIVFSIQHCAEHNASIINDFQHYIAPRIQAWACRHEVDQRFIPLNRDVQPRLFQTVISPHNRKLNKPDNMHDAYRLASKLLNGVLDTAIASGFVGSLISQRFKEVTNHFRKLGPQFPGSRAALREANRLCEDITRELNNTTHNGDAKARIQNTCQQLHDDLDAVPECLQPAIKNTILFLQGFCFNPAATQTLQNFPRKDLFFAHMDKLWNDWQLSLEAQAHPTTMMDCS